MNSPTQKRRGEKEPPSKVCLKQTCLLCSPPSFAVVRDSFAPGSPIVDIHMVKTRLGTGGPRSLESDAPIKGCTEGGERRSQDPDEDVPLNRGKVARVK